MILTVYTTAPEGLDLPGTTPVCHVGFTQGGVPIRAVQVVLADAVEQVALYLDAGFVAVGESGLHRIVTTGGHADVIISCLHSGLCGRTAP
jgi:hypothetical protein